MIRVRIKGGNLDRFIKSESKIHNLKNIQRISHTVVEFDIKGINYKKFIARCDKMCYTYKVERYSGIDRIFQGIKRHTGICVGIIFSIFLFLLSHFYILKIDIYGIDNIDKGIIIDTLDKNDVKLFSKIKEDYTPVERAIREDLENEISQISIVNKGNYLIINIREKIKTDDKNKNLDIIADCDGVIKNIEVIQGSANKKAGEFFKKNDILVKGEFLSMQGEKKECQAIANIVYTEIHTKTKVVYDKTHIYTPTGNKKVIIDVEFFGYKSNTIKNINYENFQMEEENIFLCDRFILPIKLNIKKYLELKVDEIAIDFEVEKENLINQSEKELKEEFLQSNIENIYTDVIDLQGEHILITTIEIIKTI